MAMQEDDRRRRESGRILDRVSQETDPGGTLVGRAAKRARDRLSAADVDKTDWAELWGTRIGRGLGLIISVILIGWLVLYVLGAG